MIHNQSIKANGVNEINHEGRQLKVVNAQADLLVRVFNSNGRLELESNVRAGFGVVFNKPFAKVTIQSKVEQQYSLWVSAELLSYEAPTEGANKLESSVIYHYGDDQQILGFEAGRVAAHLYSDMPYFIGGEGCTVETGIPMKAGEVNKVEVAAALNISMDIPADQTLSSSMTVHDHENTGGHSLRYPTSFNGDFYGLPTAASHGLLAKFDGDWQLNLSNGVNYYALFVFADGVAYYDDFYRLRFKSNDGAVSLISPSMPSLYSGNSLGRWVCVTGYKDSTSSNFKAVNIDDGTAIEHVHPASVKAMHYSSSLNKTIFVQKDNIVTANGLPNDWGGIPELTEIYSGSIGSVPNARITENAEYIVFNGDSGALIIKKNDMSVIFDSTKNVVFASRDGRVKAFDENQFFISENGGGTWGVAIQDTGLNLVYANRKYSVIEKKGAFYILREFGEPRVYNVVAEKQTTTPKAVIRLMREVV